MKQAALETLASVAQEHGKLLTFTADQGGDVPFTRQVNEAVASCPHLAVEEIKCAMGKAYRVKTEPELRNVETATKFLQELFKELENKVLDVLDDGSSIRQSELAAKIEDIAENDKKLQDIAKMVDGVGSFMSIPTPVLIQSGSTIEPSKIAIETKSQRLDQNTIVMNLCAKYKEICSMVARTILVNPTATQKQAYNSCLAAMEAAVGALRPGAKLSAVYQAAASKLAPFDAPALLGYGIGQAYKEEGLNITAANETVVQAGMVLHVRIGLQNLEGPENKRTVLLGDTVLVTEEGTKILTKSIPRKYGQVSYSLGEEEAKQPAPKKEKAPKPVASEEEYEEVSDDNGVIKATRLRRRDREQNCDEQDRSSHQKQLTQEKLQELENRLANEEIKDIESKSKVKDMARIRSYPNPEQVPMKKIKPGQLYVDLEHETVLVPVKPAVFAPFHISTIKNVST